jgi:hypothetical protein
MIRTPVPGGPKGTLTITAKFTGKSPVAIASLIFQVTALTGGNVLLNADGSQGVGGILTPDVGADGMLSPGEEFTVQFIIGRQGGPGRFSFFVDLLGVPSP